MIRGNLYLFIHCACFLLVSASAAAGNFTKQTSASDTLCRKPLLLHFRFDRSLVEYDYMDNPHTLAAFSSLFADSLSTARIDTVTITSYASPEGDIRYNSRLAHRRAVAVKGYLLWKYPHLNQYRILIRPQGEDWVGLRQLVEEDNAVPDRQDVLAVLHRVHDASRCKELLHRLNRGTAYRYINKHLLPELRNAAVCTVQMKETSPTSIIVPPLSYEPELRISSLVDSARAGFFTPSSMTSSREILKGLGAKKNLGALEQCRPVFSLKTNLPTWVGFTPDGNLAAFRPNLAIELFYARRWSVSASAEYSYWDGGADNDFWGISGYSLEPRFWLANNFRWLYVGAYGQFGDYDHQPSTNENTGSPAGNNVTGTYWSAGFSLGIYLALTRHLGLEAGVRIGYRDATGKTYDYEPPHYYYYHESPSTHKGITGLNLSLCYRWWSNQTKK